jgi:hypothetical protein
MPWVIIEKPGKFGSEPERIRTLLVGACAAAQIGNRINAQISEDKETNPLIPLIARCVQEEMYRRVGLRPSDLRTAIFIKA